MVGLLQSRGGTSLLMKPELQCVIHKSQWESKKGKSRGSKNIVFHNVLGNEDNVSMKTYSKIEIREGSSEIIGI